MQRVLLSAELLTQVFAHLQPGPFAVRDRRTQQAAEKRMRTVAQWANLRLVCKQFKQVLDGTAGLLDMMIVTDRSAEVVFPSVLRWLHQRSTTLRSFEGHCKQPFLDAALGALAHASSQLTMLALYAPSDITLHTLPVFKHVRTCDLGIRPATSINLKPLQALDHLRELHLEGGYSFHNLQAAKHLTALIITDAYVFGSGDCACVDTLQQLHVKDCELTAFHMEGAMACTQLQSLICHNSKIGAGKGNQALNLYMDEHEIFYDIPARISFFVSLAKLDISFVYELPQPCGLSWICQLETLQSLRLEITTQSDRVVEIPHGLTCLQHLTYLELASHSHVTCGALRLQVQWRHMLRLQSLHLSDCRLTCGTSVYRGPDSQQLNTITDLGHAPCLSRLQLTNCEVSSDDTLNLTLRLCCLCTNSPGIDIIVDGVSFSKAIQKTKALIG